MKLLELERISEDDLVVGRPLPRDVYDRNGKLLLRKGVVIESERQREKLVQHGVYHKFHDVPAKPDDLLVRPSSSAVQMLRDIQNKVTFIFNNFKGENPETRILELVDVSRILMNACSMDRDACLGSILTSKVSTYTVSHPIHVAILCGLVAKEMKWTDNDLLSLMAAALTSNLSKIDLQEALFYQKDPLTDEQKQQILRHPENTVEMLRKAGVTNDLWLKSVLYHHESMDGTGYPAGLRSYSIPVAARIIAACDIFCAAVTGRAYRIPLSPDGAVRMIFMKADRDLDNRIANMLVKVMGVYPPGTFVRLRNDETAVVTCRGRKAHQPIVHSVIGADGRKLPAPVKRDCSDTSFAIKETLPRERVKISIDPALLWHEAGRRAKK
jgi:HD-GYP domain-containing protein (c-di-GMP phosphodiesterase class II)